MGGGGGAPAPKGGKKAVDAAINLVPFIDLLSCCISFLIITAVWTQLARMNVTQKGPAATGSETEQQPDQVKLSIHINKDSYDFSKSTGENTNIPTKGVDALGRPEYDYVRLADVLKEAKQAYPDKNDIEIKADDEVIYDKVIRTMDIAVSAKFPDVSLADNGGGV
jgi:biopolymer transport protein ExbD